LWRALAGHPVAWLGEGRLYSFVELEKALESVARPGEAETHLALAIAYAEMGLMADALTEAAQALMGEGQLKRPEAADALSFLLDHSDLGFDVDVLLIALREALFVN
jgi:hypothetical protein